MNMTLGDISDLNQKVQQAELSDIEAWWNSVSELWCWSGAIHGLEWADLTGAQQVELMHVYRSAGIYIHD